MPCLSKTARPQISAILPLVSPEQTISPFLQRCSTPPCPNLPVLLSRLCRFQNRTEFRPIRRRCPPDTGRQRRLFFCSFCGTRSGSMSMENRLRISWDVSVLKNPDRRWRSSLILLTRWRSRAGRTHDCRIYPWTQKNGVTFTVTPFSAPPQDL